VQHVRVLRFKQPPSALTSKVRCMLCGSCACAKRRPNCISPSKIPTCMTGKLKMYKLNGSRCPTILRIGRSRIFYAGWLENESIFLHMHYKFLLELYASVLPRNFFARNKKRIVAFP